MGFSSLAIFGTMQIESKFKRMQVITANVKAKSTVFDPTVYVGGFILYIGRLYGCVLA